MLWVFEAELIGDFTDGQAGLDEQLLGLLDDGILDVTLCGGAALLADQVAEVVGRETGLVGEVGDGGQTVTFWMVVYKVLAELLLEGQEHLAVHLVSRDELAIVVAQAVVEHQGNSVCDESLRVFVDGVLHLCLNLIHQCHDDRALCLRQMQRLVITVIEKRIVLYLLAQRRAVEQVGMEQQSA